MNACDVNQITTDQYRCLLKKVIMKFYLASPLFPEAKKDWIMKLKHRSKALPLGPKKSR
jgi:hypothetical protein